MHTFELGVASPDRFLEIALQILKLGYKLFFSLSGAVGELLSLSENHAWCAKQLY
jgi:hypothetical protein